MAPEDVFIICKDTSIMNGSEHAQPFSRVQVSRGLGKEMFCVIMLWVLFGHGYDCVFVGIGAYLFRAIVSYVLGVLFEDYF